MESLSKIELPGLYNFNKKISSTKKACYRFFAQVSQCQPMHPLFRLFIIATMSLGLFASSFFHDIPIKTKVPEKVKKPVISSTVAPNLCLLKKEPAPVTAEPEPVTTSKESSPLHLEKANQINLDRITDQLPREEPPLRLKKGTRFHPYIFQAAKRYQVEPSLIMGIIMAESGYNPKAVSEKGAKGLMQLMPGTAKALGVQDIFNPEENINGGVKYLKQLIERYDGNIELALAAYNAGSSNVRRYKGIPPFKTTHFYIKKVIRYHQYYKKQISKEIV